MTVRGDTASKTRIVHVLVQYQARMLTFDAQPCVKTIMKYSELFRMNDRCPYSPFPEERNQVRASGAAVLFPHPSPDSAVSVTDRLILYKISLSHPKTFLLVTNKRSTVFCAKLR